MSINIGDIETLNAMTEQCHLFSICLKMKAGDDKPKKFPDIPETTDKILFCKMGNSRFIEEMGRQRHGRLFLEQFKNTIAADPGAPEVGAGRWR